MGLQRRSVERADPEGRCWCGVRGSAGEWFNAFAFTQGTDSVVLVVSFQASGC